MHFLLDIVEDAVTPVYETKELPVLTYVFKLYKFSYKSPYLLKNKPKIILYFPLPCDMICITKYISYLRRDHYELP